MYARNNSLCYYQDYPGEALDGEIKACKSAAPKMEIPMVIIGQSSLCLNMANCSNAPY